jgi:hypothetical protein
MSPRDLVYVGPMLDMSKKAISKTQSLSRGAGEGTGATDAILFERARADEAQTVLTDPLSLLRPE